MVKTFSWLSPKEKEFLEERKTLKDIRKERETYEKEKRIEATEKYKRTPLGVAESGIKKVLPGKPGRRMSFPSRIIPAPLLSQEQSILRGMFAGDDLWGSGDNLPVINHSLNSGRGIINSGDDFRETASLFGLWING